MKYAIWPNKVLAYYRYISIETRIMHEFYKIYKNKTSKNDEIIYYHD